MSRLCKILVALLLVAVMSMSLSACGGEKPQNDTTAPQTQATLDEVALLWNDATYTEETSLGKGDTLFDFQVIAGDNSVTFHIATDKENLGEALLEHELVAGDEGPYGLYVKYVNGMYADYDVNGCYWSFTKNGEMMMTGVDGETIEAGACYEMTYTK